MTLIDFEIYPTGDFQTRLDDIFADLQAYCAEHHMFLHMLRLSRSAIGHASSADYPSGILGRNVYLRRCFLWGKGFP